MKYAIQLLKQQIRDRETNLTIAKSSLKVVNQYNNPHAVKQAKEYAEQVAQLTGKIASYRDAIKVLKLQD